MPARVPVLILGGGIIGTAVAWALAERGVSGIEVVDLDLAGVYASSELNAGGVRATWWQPVNIECCRLTLDFFRAHAERFGFRERGYLWLYDDAALWQRALEKRALQNAFGLDVEALEPFELWARFPLLDRAREEILGATFSPHDGLVNPNAVRAFYRAEAERRGVVFRNRHYVSGIATARVAGAAGTLRRVSQVDVIEVARGEIRLEPEIVVNCLGAWSSVLLAKIGLRDVAEPVRRQIALVDVHASDLPPTASIERLGMIVDASGLYLHPEGPHVLAGYSTPDEAPGFDFGYDGDAFFEREIWPRLAHRMSAFERCGHVRGWAGLYDVTPDCSGLAGAIAGFSNLFEARSFTGRGVMQSYAIGRAMAGLVAAGQFDEVDLTPLARARFDEPVRWIPEELHI